MLFDQALHLMRNGKKITRAGTSHYLFLTEKWKVLDLFPGIDMESPIIVKVYADLHMEIWIPIQYEILATDWIEYDDSIRREGILRDASVSR